jgi:hypothetical protein
VRVRRPLTELPRDPSPRRALVALPLNRAVDLRFAKADGEWQIATVTVWPSGEARPE